MDVTENVDSAAVVHSQKVLACGTDSLENQVQVIYLSIYYREHCPHHHEAIVQAGIEKLTGALGACLDQRVNLPLPLDKGKPTPAHFIAWWAI